MCPREHDATVEDSYSVHIQTSKGEERQFRILDTAGEDDYQTMVDEWIKAADGYLLIFAINDQESFEALKDKVKRIKNNNKEKMPVIIVGNKCDLQDKREISAEKGMEYAKSIGAKYYETSALTDSNGNCKIVFQQCAHLILNSLNPIVKPKPSCPLCNIY